MTEITILGFSLTFWVCWIIVNCGPAWYIIYKKRSTHRPESANDPKYRPFHSLDDPYKHYSYFYPLLFHFFSIPRFLIGWSLFLGTPVIAIIFSIGEKDTKNLPKWKIDILQKMGRWSCWFATMACGFFSQKLV